ncbi:MAG: methionine gamma-lyase family protein [Phascolarctobacterium sp.]|nr:methionine gamma-lyase family protein [Phascolarctobacterium sp.]
MIDYNALELEALQEVAKHTAAMEETALLNTQKVLAAFRKAKVSDFYMKPTTGYGYDDIGRDKLDEIYADIFHTEAAMVRSQFVSGTHALAVALLGNLRPGDEIITATGAPYDTMQTIMGYPVSVKGSLTDIGVTYKEIPFEGEVVDTEALKAAISDKTTMVHIQRSCGYSSVRKTISVQEIGRVIKVVKEINPNIICLVDNCYGCFVDKIEPTDLGADIMAGSLIKNLGGGLAPMGGYIVGRKDLVENASYRATAPGLGAEMGATLGDTQREYYQGLFLAPHIVLQAVKTAIFSAVVFQKLGYEVKPLPSEKRSDLIQAIKLLTEEKLVNFCIAIQANSPVDAYVKPEPAPLPGYQDKVVMAAGTFVQGATLELSADAPCREPYNVFFQGGLTFEHGRLAIMEAAKMVGPKE